jgi:hypothetical protein
LVIGAFEDSDDGDDTVSGNCDWVLSIRSNPKLCSLAFKIAATSTSLRALIGASAETGVGEEATDAADATAFAQLLHLPEATF